MTTTSTNNTLPHLTSDKSLTDAGLETWLIFHRGIELRDFASFELLESGEGRSVLREYYRSFMETARVGGFGFVAETPTWRASSDWGERLGYSLDDLARINRDSVAFLNELRGEFGGTANITVSGNLGPRGDGYVPGDVMSVAEAQDYHGWQISALAGDRTDMMSAFTITNVTEAKGIVRACSDLDVPCVMSFTVETDGNLPTGQALRDAITEMDADPLTRPAYFMINCAHPDHFRHVLDTNADWMGRIHGLRANASRCSHAELDEAEELDDGDPFELGSLYRELDGLLPNLAVVGGCCGTDHRHVAQIAEVFR